MPSNIARPRNEMNPSIDVVIYWNQCNRNGQYNELNQYNEHNVSGNEVRRSIDIIYNNTSDILTISLPYTSLILNSSLISNFHH